MAVTFGVVMSMSQQTPWNIPKDGGLVQMVFLFNVCDYVSKTSLGKPIHFQVLLAVSFRVITPLSGDIMGPRHISVLSWEQTIATNMTIGGGCCFHLFFGNVSPLGAETHPF